MSWELLLELSTVGRCEKGTKIKLGTPDSRREYENLSTLKTCDRGKSDGYGVST